MSEIILDLWELEEATGGKLYRNRKAYAKGITGVTTDNRKLNPGELFVAVRGERTDGHKYIDAAFDAGAACVLSEEELTEPAGNYILVESSLKALRDIAAYYRNKLKINIIGIIGSVGKTSTKEMVAQVLSTRYSVLKTEGNFNNDIGMPLTLLNIRSHHEVAVVEMGINKFGEMDLLGSIARPDMVVFTNVKECHLEFLGDLNGVLKAKSEVFKHMKSGGLALVNRDDELLRNLSPEGIFVEGFGVDHGDIRGRVVENRGIFGISCEIKLGNETINADINIPGSHNIYHALAGVSVGLEFGISLKKLKEGIENASSILGRSNIISLEKGITLIDDCYNASPASVNGAIETLSLSPGRRIAVLGDMGELGEREEEIHAAIGENPGFKEIAAVFTVGPLSANIIKALKEKGYGGEAQAFPDKESLLAQLKDFVEEGDVVLIKASHFMGFSEITESLKAL